MGAIRLRTTILELENNDNFLVALLRDRNHALLAIITIDNPTSMLDDNKKINMEVYDFLPKGNSDASSYNGITTMSQLLSIVFENPSYDGHVRSRKSEHIGTDAVSLRDLWNIFKFEDSGLDAEYLFWECDPQDYDPLVASINLDIENPPRFSMGGSARLFSANGHNCYTWAKEKLSVIGVNLETTIWDRLVASEPKNHIQPESKCTIV